MPIKIKRKTRYTYKRKAAGLATVPRMYTKTLATKRKYQVSTDLKYFKVNGTLASNAQGQVQAYWRCRRLVVLPPPGFATNSLLYDQYKLLAIHIRLFPANVGIEPDPSAFPVGYNGLLRGNTVVWSDQREDALQFPSAITDIMSDGSARLINSRRPYSRCIYRPKGQPQWGSTQSPTTQPDPWSGAVYLLSTQVTPQVPPAAAPTLWFYSATYKVLFRGRRTPP